MKIFLRILGMVVYFGAVEVDINLKAEIIKKFKEFPAFLYM